MDEVIAERFFDLFAGYQSAHGRALIVQDVNAKRANKVQAKSWTVKAAPTVEIWMEHLEGTGPGIGIIPLREDDTVLWAGIDIDDREVNLHDLDRLRERHKLPLVICRSKSGGAHCYLFLREAAPAESVQLVLSRWSALLGYGGCEIFPKQHCRANADDMGNWLNMPYYNVKRATRVGIVGDEFLTDPVDFLDRAAEFATTIEDICDIGDAEEESELFKDGPPCLNHILSLGGFEDGTRNNGMYSVLVYLRRRFNEQSIVESKVQEYNAAMCHPPLPISELLTLTKQVYKKEYFYKCKDIPICKHCDRRNCLKREYGVGDGGGSASSWPVVDYLTQYEGDPCLWFASVNGTRIGPMATAQVQGQSGFRTVLIEKLLLYPPKLSEARWDKMIGPLIEKAEKIPAELDATDGAQFHYLLDQFVTQSGRARTLQDTYRGVPYWDDDGVIWFHLSGLLNYLDHMRFHIKEKTKLMLFLRSSYPDLRTKTVNVKDKKSWNVFGVPAPQTSEPEAKIELEHEEF